MRLYKLCNYPPHFFFRSLIAALRSHQVKRDRHQSLCPPAEEGRRGGKGEKRSGKTDHNARFVWLLSLPLSSSFFTCFLPFSLNLFTICLVCHFDILPSLGSAATSSTCPLCTPCTPLSFGSDLLQPCATAWKMFQVHFYERSLILWPAAEAEGEEEFCCASSNFK